MIAPPPESSGQPPAAVGVLTVDARLVVRTWDAWLATASGIASETACGRPLGEVVPAVAARGLLERFEQVLASGEVQVLAPAFHHYLVPCPPRVPSPRFDRMQQRVTLGPLRDGERVVGVMATVEDVTARIDAERELAAGLRVDDWKVRRAVVEGLARDTHPEMLAALLAALRAEHRDFNVLSSALQLLAACDVDVTEPLAALLQDPDADLRIQAALALGDRQTPHAVSALLDALGDPDANVRFHAIEALGRMRAADAVDALADIAEGDDFFFVFPAIDALARIQDTRVAPRLVPLLARPDLIEPVADALGAIGGHEAAGPMIAVLNASGPAVPLVRALAQLHERYEQRYGGGSLVVEEVRARIAPAGAQRILDALPAAGGQDLAALVAVLGWLRGPAVERALARLLAEPAVRAAVIEAIVRQDQGIVEILIEQLRSDDPDVRLAAIVALGRLGDRRAAIPLTGRLGSDRAEVVAAAAALARIGDGSAFEPLLALLAHDDATVRQAAIGALNSLGHADMPSRILQLLSASDPKVRESAARIAGYFGYRSSVDALLELSSDPVEGVRRAAVEQLPFLEDARATSRVRAALEDPAPRVRAAAAQAIAHLPRAEAGAPLLEAVRDSDAWVRYYAVRSLAELREAGAIDTLAGMAESDPAMHVRISAVEGLGGIGGPVAARLLLPLAADDTPEIAATALRALGRAGDAQGYETIKASLRSADAARRLAAIAGLRTCGTRDGIEALAWTAGADEDDRVAAAAVEALGALAARPGADGDQAVAALVTLMAEARRRDGAVTALTALPEARIPRAADALRHAHPAVRHAGIDVLARMRHPDASAAIRSALDDADPGVREAAVTALDRLGVRGLAPTFVRLSRDDASRGVRRAAAAALGRAADGPDSGGEGADGV